MSTMYESLKEVVHEISHRSKSEPTPLAPLEQSHTSNLLARVDAAQQFIAEAMDGLRDAVRQGDERIEQEAQRAQQTIAALKENLAMLEGQLAEAEEKFRREASSRDAMEDSLNAKIDALQKELTTTQQSLQSRESQIVNLNSSLDGLASQVREAESRILQAQAEVAAEVKRSEELQETFNKKIATLEADQRELLAAREEQINDLKSQLQLLTSWVQEMPSFVKQLNAVPIAAQHRNGAVATNQNVNNQRKNGAVENPGYDPTVAPIFFELIAQELVPVKGAMSSTIVRERVASLGESPEKFPRSRLPELLELLSEEIVNRNVKIAFRKWFVKHA